MKTEAINLSSHKKVQNNKLSQTPHRTHNRSLPSTWLMGFDQVHPAMITAHQAMNSHKIYSEIKIKVKMKMILHTIWTTWWIGWVIRLGFSSLLTYSKAKTRQKIENQTNNRSNKTKSNRMISSLRICSILSRKNYPKTIHQMTYRSTNHLLF